MLPFPYSVLPRLGEWLTQLLAPIGFSIAGMFVESEKTLALHSDSSIQYGIVLFLFLVAIIVAILLKKFNKNDRIYDWLHYSSCAILFVFLCKYGVDKIYLLQFPEPEPNLVYTPVGQLHKDILFWTSTGTSSIFNYVIGFTQIAIAMLLLSARLRFVGILFSVVSFAYIFLINISFDISVKLLSATLFVNSLNLLSTYPDRIKNLLGYQVPLAKVKKQDSKRWHASLKAIFVAIVCLEVLLPFTSFNSSETVGSNARSGAYEVIESSESELFSDAKKIFLRTDNFLVLEEKDHTIKDYPVTWNIANNRMKFKDVYVTVNRAKLDDSLQLKWNEQGKEMCLTLKRLPWKTLPVFKDEFHLVLEQFK